MSDMQTEARPLAGRRILIGKPGLDGHSNGAEVIAVSARHVGFDVVYAGIRLSAQEIVRSAVATLGLVAAVPVTTALAAIGTRGRW